MHKNTMTAAARHSLRWGAILFIATVIVCQLSFSVASSDSSDAEEPEVQSPSTHYVRRSLPQAATSDDESSPQNSSLSGALVDSGTNTLTSNVPDLSGLSEGLSRPAHDENDASDESTTGAVPPVGSFSRRAQTGFPLARFSTVRRVLALCVMLFFTALAGGIIYNFKPVAAMMADDKAYAELCPVISSPSNNTRSVQALAVDALSNRSSTLNETIPSGGGQQHMYICNAQEAQTEGLYTVAFATACVANTFAGSLIDSIGSRSTSFIGHLLEIIGLLLFSFRRYTAGLALVGAGQAVAFLASLSLARMFPQLRGRILGLLGSLGSLSTLVPNILRLIVSGTSLTLQQVMWCYAGIVSLPALIAGVCLLPSQHSIAPTGDGAEPIPPRREASEETVASAGESAQLSQPISTAGGPIEETAHCARKRSGPSQGAGALRTVLRGVYGLFANPAFRENLFSVPTLAVALNFTIACTTCNYFLQAAERIFYGSAAHQLGYFCPASALPCVLIGLVPDRFGASVASLILAVAGLIMNSTSFIRHSVGGYVSLVSLMVYVSALTVQVHWSSQELYSPQCRTTLSGLILAVGGALSLVANFLYSTVTLDMFAGNTTSVRLGLGILQLLQLLLIYVTYRHIQRRNGRDDRATHGLRRLLRRRRYTAKGHAQIRELPD